MRARCSSKAPRRSPEPHRPQRRIRLDDQCSVQRSSDSCNPVFKDGYPSLSRQPALRRTAQPVKPRFTPRLRFGQRPTRGSRLFTASTRAGAPNLCRSVASPTGHPLRGVGKLGRDRFPPCIVKRTPFHGPKRLPPAMGPRALPHPAYAERVAPLIRLTVSRMTSTAPPRPAATGGASTMQRDDRLFLQT